MVAPTWSLPLFTLSLTYFHHRSGHSRGWCNGFVFEVALSSPQESLELAQGDLFLVHVVGHPKLVGVGGQRVEDYVDSQILIKLNIKFEKTINIPLHFLQMRG